jgi:hypothetical protein
MGLPPALAPEWRQLQREKGRLPFGRYLGTNRYALVLLSWCGSNISQVDDEDEEENPADLQSGMTIGPHPVWSQESVLNHTFNRKVSSLSDPSR